MNLSVTTTNLLVTQFPARYWSLAMVLCVHFHQWLPTSGMHTWTSVPTDGVRLWLFGRTLLKFSVTHWLPQLEFSCVFVILYAQWLSVRPMLGLSIFCLFWWRVYGYCLCVCIVSINFVINVYKSCPWCPSFIDWTIRDKQSLTLAMNSRCDGWKLQHGLSSIFICRGDQAFYRENGRLSMGKQVNRDKVSLREMKATSHYKIT